MQLPPYIMSKRPSRSSVAAGLWALSLAALAQPQSGADHIVTNVSAELEPGSAARNVAGGSAPGRPEPEASAPKLLPAQRVVPGDVLVYTVEVRNAGQYSAESPVVIQPIPNHMMYVADSAVGPGVDVDYSVDGGHTFDKPENLKLTGAAGRAPAADYTHIRWHLRIRLKPDSIAYLRFRAQVK